MPLAFGSNLRGMTTMIEPLAMAATGTVDLITLLLIENLAQGHAIIGACADPGGHDDPVRPDEEYGHRGGDVSDRDRHSEPPGVNADPYLMAVVVGGSCAFLAPMGHQNNTLILGPGAFRFGDHWRLGLPAERLVVVVSIPMLLLVWPL
jgi:hypothetical protein